MLPITWWSTGEFPTTATHSRRKIRSVWYEQRSGWKKSAADLALPMPTGWTPHEVKLGSTSTSRDELPLWLEGCGDYVYKHRDLPDDDFGPTDTFFYPFPVPDITATTPPDMPAQRHSICSARLNEPVFGHVERKLLIMTLSGGI